MLRCGSWLRLIRVWAVVVLAVTTLIVTGAVSTPLAVAQQEVVDEGDDAEEEDDVPAIRDNSFLVEEAFNQEQGVVQYINTFHRAWDRNNGDRSRSFDFVFTHEIPVGSQQHQFSYAIPFSSFTDDPVGGPRFAGDGLGDMQLNYRYQLLTDEESNWWFSPRFSVILDTANERKGLGTGTTGYQVNLPFSREFCCYATHFNAGLTILPDAQVAQGDGTLSPETNLMGYNLGWSLIRIADDKFQPLVEVVANWDDTADGDGIRSNELQVLLSPGFRWAPYTEGDTQLVLGAAVPIGLTNESPDVGLFFYLSYEHRVRAER